MLYFKGAPTWYITFAPADSRHPISLHMAGNNMTFKSSIMSESDRKRLLSNNQVASARFFHFMVKTFLKHILCVGEEKIGLWGKTNAYYGTVEEQGCLKLHLHLLLWIQNSLTPQEIRDRIMDPKLDFQQDLVKYLEDMHQGHFFNGTMEDVRANLDSHMQSPDYIDPTMTLPESISQPCIHKEHTHCNKCPENIQWWTKFKATVDELLFRLNRHMCRLNKCKNTRWKKCKARFPRPLHKETNIDPATGYLNLRHG